MDRGSIAAVQTQLLCDIAANIGPAPPPTDNIRVTDLGDIRFTDAGDTRVWT